jgi:hypothetical protein
MMFKVLQKATKVIQVIKDPLGQVVLTEHLELQGHAVIQAHKDPQDPLAHKELREQKVTKATREHRVFQ